MFTRLIATALSALLIADPAFTAAFQIAPSSLRNTTVTDPSLFGQEALDQASIYSDEPLHRGPSVATKLTNGELALTRTMDGGNTQTLNHDTFTGLVIRTGQVHSATWVGRQHDPDLEQDLSDALNYLEGRADDALRSEASYAIHLVDQDHNNGDAFAYLYPHPANPDIGFSYQIHRGIKAARAKPGTRREDIAAIRAFILQHEMRHSLQERTDLTSSFDRLDEKLRITDDFHLIQNGFFSKEARDLLSKVEEFRPLLRYIWFLEGLGRMSEQQRRAAILHKAIEVVETGSKHRTMPIASAPTLEERLKEVFPANTHPILRQLKSVGPIQELNPPVGYIPTSEENELVDEVIAEFGPGHALAAMDGMRYAAVGYPVGKFSDAIATHVLTSWYNFLLKLLGTQAAEGARDSASTVKGKYGMLRLFYRQAKIIISYANDPVEVTQRLQQLFYMACYCIASYASEAIYKLHGKEMPTLRLPDHVYMMGVTGPKDSGVKINLGVPHNQWVAENMRRAGSVRGRKPNEVRITGVLIRERHLDLINDAFKVLGLRMDHIGDAELRGFFEENADKVVQFKSMAQLSQFKEVIKKHHRGIAYFANNAGGSIKMVTDGDLMANTEIVDGVADLSFGAGGVAEAMIKTRSAYHAIDFEGMIISHIATEDGNPEALQVLDPRARMLTNGKDINGKPMKELDAVRDAGLEPDEVGRVMRFFSKDDLAGGSHNVTLVTVPLGDPDTKASNYMEGLKEVEILKEGEEVKITLLAVEPSGRRRLIPLVFDTGLADLLSHAASLESARKSGERSEELSLLYTSIGRVYGDLRMYTEAGRFFRRAIREMPEGKNTERIVSLQEYYEGMQELLTQFKPKIDKVQGHFEKARELGHTQARMMLEVLNPKLPKVSDHAGFIRVLDDAIKAIPKTATSFFNRLVLAFLEFGPQHVWYMRLSLIGMSRLEPAPEFTGAYNRNVSRILRAVLDNRALEWTRPLRNPPRVLLHQLIEDPSASAAFKALAAEALESVAKDELNASENQRDGFGTFPRNLLDWIIANASVIAGFSAPGGGKGTLMGPLRDALNARMRELGLEDEYVDISTGDWLRKLKEGLLNDNGSLRQSAERDASLERMAIAVWTSLDAFRIQMDEMDHGQLLNAGTVDELLRQILRHPDVRGKRIILDGWPRLPEQLKTLQNENIMRQIKRGEEWIDVPFKIDFSITLEVPEPILRLRSLFRWLERSEAGILKKKPRADDLPARHAARMVEMENETTPVIRELQQLPHAIMIRGYTMPEWDIAERYRTFVDDLMRFGDDKTEIFRRIDDEKTAREVDRLSYFDESDMEPVSKARVRENFVEALNLYRAELELPIDSNFGAEGISFYASLAAVSVPFLIPLKWTVKITEWLAFASNHLILLSAIGIIATTMFIRNRRSFQYWFGAAA